MRKSLSIAYVGLVLLAGLIACVPDARASGSVAGSPAGSLAPAAGRFLVARASMADPRFRRTVILLVRYGEDGAVGVVVNRSTDVTLAQAFPLLAEVQGLEQLLWAGGPVEQDRPALLVEAPGPLPGSLAVMDNVHFSRSVELLKDLAASGARRFRVYAGYAGWAPGQLDGELARDAWTVVPASAEHVFSNEEEGLWRTLDAASAGTWVLRSPGTAMACARATRAHPIVSRWRVGQRKQRGHGRRNAHDAHGGREVTGATFAVGRGYRSSGRLSRRRSISRATSL